MEKIDTQGMSGEAVKGCKDNIYPKDADGNCIYPPFNPTPLPIFDTKERAELKEIMLEALREYYMMDYNYPPSPYRLDELQE